MYHAHMKRRDLITLGAVVGFGITLVVGVPAHADEEDPPPLVIIEDWDLRDQLLGNPEAPPAAPEAPTPKPETLADTGVTWGLLPAGLILVGVGLVLVRRVDGLLTAFAE